MSGCRSWCARPGPADVRAGLARAYNGLGISPGAHAVPVAVRACPVGGRPADSFAGVHVTRTNVRGHDALIEAIVECWASAVSFRALTYRVCRGLEDEPCVAVLVQEMVPAQKAGVAVTTDPVGGIADRVVVEAAFGQGAVVADGSVEPDTYVFRRPGMEPVSVHVGHQTHQVVRGRDGNDLTTTLDPYRAAAQVLDEREAAAVAEAARRAQARLGSPRAVEWAMVHGQVSILQAAPAGAGSRATHAAGRRLRGRGASAGRVTGPVHILRRPEGPTTGSPAGSWSSRAVGRDGFPRYGVRRPWSSAGEGSPAGRPFSRASSACPASWEPVRRRPTCTTATS